MECETHHSISGMSNTGTESGSNNQNNHSTVRHGSHPKIKKDSHTTLGADNAANFEDESDVGSLNTKSEVAYTGDSAPPSVFSDDHLSLAGSATSELKELSKDAQADDLMNMLDGLERNGAADPPEGESVSSDAVATENSHTVTGAVAEAETQRFILESIFCHALTCEMLMGLAANLIRTLLSRLAVKRAARAQ